jgi:hypothetical protein
MAGTKVSAVDIKELYYGDISLITTDLTAEALKTLLSNSELKKVANIHQDTWTIEEAEASQDSYKDQLSGLTYRRGSKTMGDLTFNWTIGRYDYETKADFIGGETIGENGWKRSREAVEKNYLLIALTEDDQYCVLPEASIMAREAQTDGAIGIAVVGTMLIPQASEVSPEYWFDKSAVDA